MNLNLKVEVDDASLTQMINVRITRTVESELSSQFNRGGTGNGPMTKHISEYVENRLNSQEVADAIERIVERDWKAILEASVTKALEHKANKLAFAITKQRLSV